MLEVFGNKSPGSILALLTKPHLSIAYHHCHTALIRKAKSCGSDCLCFNVSCLCHCRYQGPLLEEGSLESAVSGGATSPEFTKLCAWIVSELRLYSKLEENVHATNCKTYYVSLSKVAPEAQLSCGTD